MKKEKVAAVVVWGDAVTCTTAGGPIQARTSFVTRVYAPPCYGDSGIGNARVAGMQGGTHGEVSVQVVVRQWRWHRVGRNILKPPI